MTTKLFLYLQKCQRTNFEPHTSSASVSGSQAADHRHHESQGRPPGNGDVGCFQHDHPHPQHLRGGAAGGGPGGTHTLHTPAQIGRGLNSPAERSPLFAPPSTAAGQFSGRRASQHRQSREGPESVDRHQEAAHADRDVSAGERPAPCVCCCCCFPSCPSVHCPTETPQTAGWVLMEFPADVRGSKRIECNELGHVLTSSVVRSGCARRVLFPSKIFTFLLAVRCSHSQRVRRQKGGVVVSFSRSSCHIFSSWRWLGLR